MTIDRYLESALLRQRGQNQKLAAEILEKLTPESKKQLFHILQDMEDDLSRERRNARSFTAAVQTSLRRAGIVS